MVKVDDACRHPEVVDGRCTVCGECSHEVILNRVCFVCGEVEPEVTIKPEAQSIVPATKLVRRRS